MHFCQNELYAIMMAIPALAWLVAWLRQRWQGVKQGIKEAETRRAAAWWLRSRSRQAPVPGPSTSIRE